MKRTLAIALVSLTAVSLASCSRGGDKEPIVESTTTVDTRVVPPTLPAGEVIELGSVSSEIQELEKPCADALQPIRDLQKKYQSGLELTDDDRPDFNQALSDGFGACSNDDWKNFQEYELKGWMNAVPSPEAIARAEAEALERQDAAGTSTATTVADDEDDE
jgi:hypothetical protein